MLLAGEGTSCSADDRRSNQRQGEDAFHELAVWLLRL
jgi:hypothetical protein